MIPPISMLGAIGVSYVIGKGYSGHYAICVVCGLNVVIHSTFRVLLLGSVWFYGKKVGGKKITETDE
jgi:hypothetical protein